ncbi:MAG: YlbF family regulator [Eubacteriales bacterium]
MPLTDKALDMCRELGKLLADTDEFKRMKESELKLMKDPEARKYIEDLQIAQAEQRRMQLAGQNPTEEDKKNFREAERVAMTNPLVKMSHDANTDFQLLLNEITAKIKAGIREYSQKKI